jgi:hypothetical protein
MRKKRRPARPPVTIAKGPGENRAAVSETASPVPQRFTKVGSAPTKRKPVALLVISLYGSIALAGVLTMTLLHRWASPEHSLQWTIGGLSIAVAGIAGGWSAWRRRDSHPATAYFVGTLRDTTPVMVALIAVNVVMAQKLSNPEAVEADAKLSEQVDRLSAERKDLMKALFAAGKYETQAESLKARLQERESALASAETERTTLRGELEALKSQLASEQTRISAARDATQAQTGAAAEASAANVQRLAQIEAAQRETRRELQAIQADLKRGRKVTETRIRQILAKMPAEPAVSPE